MTLNQINQFLASKKFAIVGVSQTKTKFGNTIFKELKKKGFNIVPVNPNMEKYEGDKCYKSVSEFPEDVDAIIVVTNPIATESIVKEAVDKGIKQIFIQQGAHNDAAVKYAEEQGVNIITKKCILMFAKPDGPHNFHAFLSKLFRTYPR